MLILSYLRTGADWTELWSSNADWFGLGLLPNGFGPDWIPSNESVSYSVPSRQLMYTAGNQPFTWVAWVKISVCFTYRIYPFETFKFFCSCIQGLSLSFRRAGEERGTVAAPVWRRRPAPYDAGRAGCVRSRPAVPAALCSLPAAATPRPLADASATYRCPSRPTDGEQATTADAGGSRNLVLLLHVSALICIRYDNQ